MAWRGAAIACVVSGLAAAATGAAGQADLTGEVTVTLDDAVRGRKKADWRAKQHPLSVTSPATFTVTVTRGRWPERFAVAAPRYNRGLNPARMIEARTEGGGVRLKVQVDVYRDFWGPGGTADYDIRLARAGSMLEGTYTGTLRENRPWGTRPAETIDLKGAARGTIGPVRHLRLPAVFSDNMVLQRGMPAAIWGRARPGERVTVALRGRRKTADAGADGAWSVGLEAMDASPASAGAGEELTVTAGDESIRLKDVLVGEVWLGAGQSNMNFPVHRAGQAEQEIAAADHPRLRLSSDTLSIPGMLEYQTPGGGRWVKCAPATVKEFSALMYFCGRELQRRLDVPVGLICRAVGGSRTCPWAPAEALRADSAIRPTGEMPAGADAPGNHYAERIAPVVPYGLRGILWDQGESGTGIPGVGHYPVMSVLVAAWRRAWHRPDMPFVFVQKPSGGGWTWKPGLTDEHGKAVPRPALPPTPRQIPDEWGGYKREEYQRLMGIGHAGMVVAMDLEGGTHPHDKQSYGRRMADVALGLACGEQTVWCGPVYDRMKIEGAEVRIFFRHVGGGLVARSADGPQGFMVSGRDRRFHWAEARIDGEAVVVRSDAVPEPAAVRYAWALQPEWANLFNKQGLPALTFRTDDWPRPQRK